MSERRFWLVWAATVIAGHADGACRLWDARSDVCALDMGPRDSTAAVRAVAAEGHFVASLNCGPRVVYL